MRIGAQFYTLREFTKTPEDLAQTLKKTAQIGYTCVQLSGTCDFDPTWMADQLKRNGLECAVTHTKPARIAEAPETVADEHQIFGCSRIGIGSCPGGMSSETYDGFVRDFAPVAKRLRERGAKLYYHNHWQEFVKDTDGKRFLEKLCEAFPAENLGVILDTYWVQFAGADPVQWIEDLKGRVDCVHFKDMACFGKTATMMPVGEGNMNWERILTACEDAKTEYVLVEQDDCGGRDPFECMRSSYEYLRSLGLN